MTEANTGLRGDVNVLHQTIESTAVSITTSATQIIAPVSGIRFNAGSLVVYNGGTGGTLTLRVFGQNRQAAGTVGGASSGWSQIGNDITVTTGTSANAQWTGVYKKIAVIGLMGTGTATDVVVDMLLVQQ